MKRLVAILALISFCILLSMFLWATVTYFGLNESGDGSTAYVNYYLTGMRFQNTAGTGTLTEIGINIAAVGTGNFRLGIYADSAGSPGALILDAGEVAVASGWISKTGLNVAVTNGAYYWLAFQNAGGDSEVYYKLSQPADSRSRVVMGYGAMPDPFGAGSTDTTQICMRGGVTAAASWTNMPAAFHGIIWSPKDK